MRPEKDSKLKPNSNTLRDNDVELGSNEKEISLGSDKLCF